jgi:hypothetical protein
MTAIPNAIHAHELKTGDRILFKSPFDPTLSPILRRRSVRIRGGKPYVRHDGFWLQVFDVRPERINTDIKIWETERP